MSRLKKLSQEREIKSLGILLVVIVVVWAYGAFFPSHNPLASLSNRLVVVFVSIVIWASAHWIRLQRQKSRLFSLATSKKITSDDKFDGVLLAIQQIRENVQEAVRFLKQQLSSHRAGFAAFHQIPWYFVIGDSQAGKTTLISRAELNFLAADHFVELTPPDMETQQRVNWWFASGAVLVDIPGTYMFAPEKLTPARAAWLELLRQIRHVRRRRPLNGIVLVLDVENLVTEETKSLHNEENSLIFQIHMRLQEMSYRLKQRLPLYIICTKMDKVPGFSAYFADLGKSERDEALGISFPLTLTRHWSEVFSKAFEEMMQNIQQRVLWRLHHEPDAQKRQEILAFPHHFHLVKENLQRQLYQLGQLHQNVGLRGVYFSSAMIAETEAEDKLSQTVNKEFALMPMRQQGLRWQQPARAFFVKKLFQQRVFPEAASAINTLQHAVSKTSPAMGYLALGLASAIIISALWALSTHYDQQKQQLAVTSSALANYKFLQLSAVSTPQDVNKLLPELNALHLAASTIARADLPWLLHFQLHHAHSLAELTQLLYQRVLQTQFIPAVRFQVAQQLMGGNITDPQTLYALLKAYVMLSHPADTDYHWLSQWMSHSPIPLNQRDDFLRHFDAALQAGLITQPENTALLTNVRAQLNALPYAQLSSAVFQAQLPLTTFQPVPNAQHSFVFPAQGMPSVYQISALTTVDRKITEALQITIEGNAVLGQKLASNISADTIKQLRQNLLTQYAQNYSVAWQNWLSRVKIRHFYSLSQLELALQELSSKQSPLRQILQVVTANTQMQRLNDNDAVFDTTLQQNVQSTFVNWHLLQENIALKNVSVPLITATLQQLAQQIHSVGHAKNSPQAAWDLLQQNQQYPAHNVLLRLNQMAAVLPSPLNEWLITLSQRAQTLLLVQANRYLATQWQVPLAICQKASEEYPLQANAATGLSLTAFTQLFAPQGVLAHFYQQHLTAVIDTSTAGWQWRSYQGIPFNTNTQPVAQFERAAIIQKLYFDSDGKLSVPFQLQLAWMGDNVRSAQLALGDKTLRNLPWGQKQSFVWPGNLQTATLTLTDTQGKTYHLQFDGDWALFHLLDQAQIKPATDGKSFSVLFNVDGNKVLYTLTAASPLNPFVPGVIQAFRCPQW